MKTEILMWIGIVIVIFVINISVKLWENNVAKSYEYCNENGYWIVTSFSGRSLGIAIDPDGKPVTCTYKVEEKMITREYIQNLSKLQEKIEDLVRERAEYSAALLPIIKQYCKIENIVVDSIGKIEVDTGEINPSHIHVTCIEYGYRGSQATEYTVEIPVWFFINENAIEELKTKRESEKNIAAEKERQRKIRQLNEQVQSLKLELEKLVTN